MKLKVFENPQFGEIKDGVSSIKVIDSLGREQQATFINEQNLLSNLKQA